MYCILSQWRRNEFESGGNQSGAKVGAPIRHKAPEKIFFWSGPSTFLALEVQLVVLVSAFVMVSIYGLVSILFAVLLLTVHPRAQPFVKVGARAPVPHGVGATVISLR